MNFSNIFKCINCDLCQPFSFDVNVNKVKTKNSYSKSTIFLTGVKSNEIIISFGPGNTKKCRKCFAINRRDIEYAHILFKDEKDIIQLYKKFGYPLTNKIIKNNKLENSSCFSTKILERDITFMDIIKDLSWIPLNKRIETLIYEDKTLTDPKTSNSKISSILRRDVLEEDKKLTDLKTSSISRRDIEEEDELYE